MASLVEHSIFNNFDEELRDAIIAAGGTVPEGTCPCDYPSIIKDQLTTTKNIVLEGGLGIKIVKDGDKYTISANTEATTTNDLRPPYNIDNDPDIDTIPAGTSAQEVFNKLFENILPSLPSVLSGDIIKASDNGTDQYQNPNYPETGIKSGLNPSEYYIRLFLASKQEPIYISCAALINNAGGEPNVIDYVSVGGTKLTPSDDKTVDVKAVAVVEDADAEGGSSEVSLTESGVIKINSITAAEIDNIVNTK